jgi:hypothetical protein
MITAAVAGGIVFLCLLVYFVYGLLSWLRQDQP